MSLFGGVLQTVDSVVGTEGYLVPKYANIHWGAIIIGIIIVCLICSVSSSCVVAFRTRIYKLIGISTEEES